MGDDENGRAQLLAGAAQGREHVLPARRAELAGRLVGQQDTRRVRRGHHDGEGDAPLLASGQLGRAPRSLAPRQAPAVRPRAALPLCAAHQGLARRPRNGLDHLQLLGRATPMGRTLRWSVRPIDGRKGAAQRTSVISGPRAS
ncbi:hypothetical protein ACWFR5_39655 [Streptomyces sp. NPDC055092]